MVFKKKPLTDKQIAQRKFILEQLEEGYCLAEICRKWPAKVPTQQCVWKWRRKDEKFRADFDTAYETLIHRRIQEVDQLSDTPIPSLVDVANQYGLIDHKGNLDLRAANMQLSSIIQARKIRIDALKFLTATIAPKISQEFRSTRQLDVNVKTQYQIMDFSGNVDPIDVTPELEDLKYLEQEN